MNLGRKHNHLLVWIGAHQMDNHSVKLARCVKKDYHGFCVGKINEI